MRANETGVMQELEYNLIAICIQSPQGVECLHPRYLSDLSPGRGVSQVMVKQQVSNVIDVGTQCCFPILFLR